MASEEGSAISPQCVYFRFT